MLETPLHDGLSPEHKYVTIISPSAPKGLCIFLAVAAALPDVKFLAVATKWTDQLVQATLMNVDNVTVVPADPNVDNIFKQTRVLLAPSIWAEAFGLVAMEALQRGIPCISSAHGGLPEANRVSEMRVETPLTFCMRRKEFHNEGYAECEPNMLDRLKQCTSRDFTKAQQLENGYATFLTVADEHEAAGYVERLTRLLGDRKYYRRVALKARSEAAFFLQDREGKLQEFLESVDFDAPHPDAGRPLLPPGSAWTRGVLPGTRP